MENEYQWYIRLENKFIVVATHARWVGRCVIKNAASRNPSLSERK